MSRECVVVCNPVSGAGRARELLGAVTSESAVVRALAEACGASAPASWPVVMTTPGGSWREELQSHLKPLAGAKTAAVIAIGGDGTIAQVAALLYSLQAKAALVAVPGGRGNDFARTLLGYSQARNGPDFWEWCGARGPWRERRLDLMSANGMICLNMASLGYGARIVENAHSRRAPWSRSPLVYQVEGALAYLGEGLGARQGRCKVKSDGKSVYEGPFFGAFVGNGRSNGDGLYWLASAQLNDGRIDGIVFPKPGALALTRGLGRVKRQELPAFAHRGFRGSEIAFHFDGEVPLELDGEFAGRGARHRFSALPGALSTWVPD